MNNFQKLMGGRKAAQPAQRAPDLATLIGPATPRDLLAADFSPGQQIVGSPSLLTAFVVPRGDVQQILVGRPFRAYLGARHAATVDTEAAETTATIDLGGAGLGLVRSTRAAPSFPTQLHPDVRAYKTVASVRTAINVASVNFATGEVGVAGLTAEASNLVEIYYLPSRGTVRFRAVQPSGSDQHSVELFNSTLRALHETDQASGVTAPRINRPGLVGLALGPKWQFAIEVTTPDAIPWGATASELTQLVIPSERAPVITGDERALNAALSAVLRGA